MSSALYMYEAISMQRIEFLDDNSMPTGTLYLVVMMGISVLSFSMWGERKILHDVICSRFLIFMMWVYFISILQASSHQFTRANYVLIILPPLLLLFASLYSKLLKSDAWMVWCMTAVAVGLAINFALNMTELLATKRTSASYYIIFFLPFLLCHRNTIVKVFGIVFAFVISVLSLKLGGTLSVSLGLIVYLMVKQIGLNGKRFNVFSTFLITAVLVLLVYFALYLNDNMLEGMLLEHFDESSSTGGSGRFEIYSKYINMIYNSSFLHFFGGHGWVGSEYDSHIGVTCHNDFLEAFVDFGFIGFLLYIIFHISLFSKCRKMVRQKSEYAPAMAASVTMFFINSMVAHILIYPWFFMIFGLFWGFVLSRHKKLIC